MPDPCSFELAGARGRIVLHVWPHASPRYLALIAHGYGEHAGRYSYVAERLAGHGAAVYAPDHLGHGRSEGARALVERLDDLVEDLHVAARRARSDHPGLPLVLIGHSLGGLIATRFTQLHAAELVALVLSAPALGGDAGIEALLAFDPVPEVPIDPTQLSRDESVGRAYAADPLVWHGPFRRTTLEALLSGMRDVAAGPSFGSIPTLWIHGDDDGVVPVEQVRPVLDRVRGERFESIVYPGARHELFNETNRDDVLSAVLAFLDRSL
jgi:alpha-beta hydrolase superfamily lysophospholipase